MSSEIAVKEATVFPVAGYEDPIQEEAPEEGWNHRWVGDACALGYMRHRCVGEVAGRARRYWWWMVKCNNDIVLFIISTNRQNFQLTIQAGVSVTL